MTDDNLIETREHAEAHAEVLEREVLRLRVRMARALKAALACRDGSANEAIIAVLSGRDLPPQWWDGETP